jgi:3-oxoacyl-[acyl-carrier protein] reductase/pteridine reductase
MESAHSLAGKVALVTGAAKRIGREIALRLAAEGAKVALHYNHSEEAARQTASECGGQTFQANLASVPDIRNLFHAVEQTYGRLDLLVNNAGAYLPTPILEATEEQWDTLHAVNLKAIFFCCQAGVKLMLKNGGGRIVNISSLGGFRPWSQYPAYCASEAGGIMLTKTLAKALAPEISVNSVAPGVIHFDAEMPPKIERLISATPMQRHGTGQEIAEAVVYFATCSPFVTGQVLAVDGGLSLRA